MREAAGHPRPIEGVLVARERGAEPDLDAGADRELDRLDADHRGGAVALGAELDPAIAGGDDKGATGGKDGAGDHAQTIAERATAGQPQQLG